jgi:hypothetical protein
MIHIIFAIVWLAIGVTVRLTMPDTIENHVSWATCMIIANVYVASLFVASKDKDESDQGV